MGFASDQSVVTTRQFERIGSSMKGNHVVSSDTVFQRALVKLLIEIFDGPPGNEAYLLNPGDPGLLRQLDLIDAGVASSRPMPGKTTIASHVDHVHYGFTLMNRWAAGEPNPLLMLTGTPAGNARE